MKLAPQLIGEDWAIISPADPVDPTVYAQTFSPEYPDVVTLNGNSVFKSTTNALVMQKDELAGQYSPAPQIPVEQPNLARIALIGVGVFFIYKIIFKKGK